MFTKLRLFVFATLCVVMIGACGDDDTGTNNPPANTNSLSATFDGQSWVATNANAVRTQLLNALNISGSRPSGSGLETLAITMSNVTSTGTYSLGVGMQGTGQITTGGILYTTGMELGKKYGEVQITKFSDGRVAGTFTMTLFQDADMSNPAKQLTSGSFDIALTQ